MTIRKPEYYDEFVCTANKCPLTCCREWKIEVDDETNEKWKKLQAPENVYPVRKNMSQYTQKKDNRKKISHFDSDPPFRENHHERLARNRTS